MGKRWYGFSDETRTEVTGSYASKQDASHDPQEELEESDPRVQEFLGPSWARAKIQEYLLDGPEELFRVCSRMNMSPPFAWRGQADISWQLTTELERDRDEVFVKEIGLHTFENRILIEAQRRAHHHFSDFPKEKDLLGWLAFLRHHGVPTRLLDVTWSPFIAAFFAVSEGHDDKDGVLWMFSQSALSLGRHRVLVNSKKPFKRTGSWGHLIDSYQPPNFPVPPKAEPREITQKDLIFSDDLTLLELATKGALSLKLVMVLEPSQWISPRQAAQQGAFMVPVDLGFSFQENLEGTIDQEFSERAQVSPPPFPQDQKEIQTVAGNASVLKLIIPAKHKAAFRNLLGKMNIRGSILFPDHQGWVMDLKAMVPPKGSWKA